VALWKELDADYAGWETDSSRSVRFAFHNHDVEKLFFVTVSLPSGTIDDFDGAIPNDIAPQGLIGRRLQTDSEAGTGYEVKDVSEQPRTDGELGLTVKYEVFWTGQIPAVGGDICEVRLASPTGQSSSRETAAMAPISDGSRDGFTEVEMDLPSEVGAVEPHVNCELWRGAGLVEDGPTRLTDNQPSRQMEPPSDPTTAWVIGEVEWQGAEFPTVWDCTARVFDEEGQLLGESAGRVYHNPEVAPSGDFEVAVTVDTRTDPEAGDSSQFDCKQVSPELSPG
jgi:hypothetical protein